MNATISPQDASAGLRSVRRFVRRRIWHRRAPLRYRLKLWWHRLWIRRNEFHRTLNIDTSFRWVMCDCEWDAYCADVTYRRGVAHERHLKRSTPNGPDQGRRASDSKQP